MRIPGCSSRWASISIAENRRLKRVGASTQPCFTPLVTANASDAVPLSVTRTVIPRVGASTQPCITPLVTANAWDTVPLSVTRAVIPFEADAPYA
ncbi:unnamed protein product [Schistocephalus solidus]|uniref:Uncharacterized protein n=1 Tax=Schistocephalus solidus TaxID=70667 RepID=A0A183SBZ2_SCHSO|nr:unnamed protein product [Schistocephalus solidus]